MVALLEITSTAMAAPESVSVSSDLHVGAQLLTMSTDYVNNNPAAFAEAYWEFASLRVYQ